MWYECVLDVCRQNKFYPLMCLVVNDNPEGQKLVGVYDSAKANYGCRVCWCKGANFSRPGKGRQADMRTVTRMQYVKSAIRRRGSKRADWKKYSCEC